MNRFVEKLGGASWLLAGPLFALGLMFHPDEFVPGAVADVRWVPVHLVMLAAFVLMVPGMFAAWSRHQRNSALVIGALGSILAVIIAGIEAFALQPLLAHAEKPMMEELFANYRPIGMLFAVSIPLWIAGNILTGIGCLKSGMKAGWLLIAGAVLCAAPIHFFGGAGPIVKLLVGASYGGGLAWIGFSLSDFAARRDQVPVVVG
jgi:hypothetical protein